MFRFAECPFRNHVGYGSVVISHKEFSPPFRPTTLKQLVSYVSYARIAKKVGGIWIMNARQRYLDDPSLPVEIRQKMPPASSASKMGKFIAVFQFSSATTDYSRLVYSLKQLATL